VTFSFPTLGDTAVLCLDPHGPKHIWFFVSDRTDQGIVMFNGTTWKKNQSDETCILTSADHSYFTHRSVIHYRGGILLNEGKFKRIVESFDYQPHTRATDALVRKIQLGALDTNGRTAQHLQDIIRPFLIAEPTVPTGPAGNPTIKPS
jgi:hypothetical protein